MKQKVTIIISYFVFLNAYAQDKITVSIGANSTYIETYNKNSWSEEFTIEDAYRLGPSNLKTLKAGVKTSLKWIELNNSHYKTFQKEVCRFKTMEKELFKFHGYVDQFAEEMTMIFYGEEDGSFRLEIKPYDSFSKFIVFTDIEMLEKFQDLLNGKSANIEIDDIFKN